tara:strand:- start:1301 stop:1609 length:309 start_codon:yes stop_codon:yes gene_type:complete
MREKWFDVLKLNERQKEEEARQVRLRASIPKAEDWNRYRSNEHKHRILFSPQYYKIKETVRMLRNMNKPITQESVMDELGITQQNMTVDTQWEEEYDELLRE